MSSLFNKLCRRSLPFAGLLNILFMITSCGQFVFLPLRVAYAATTGSQNWAGYEATGKQKTYTEVTATFTVPRITPTAGLTRPTVVTTPTASIQVSIGGDPQYTSQPEQVDLRIDLNWDYTASKQVNQIWWEIIGQPNGKITPQQITS